ncbi:hypothetical protein NE611_17435, partial [Anaerostipes caccae]|nr:hypothetical protein [Anaerostipes caccae]
MKNTLPMNIQFFAEPGGEPPAADPGQTTTAQTAPQTVDFDYEKLAEIVSGKQSATAESVLRGY